MKLLVRPVIRAALPMLLVPLLAVAAVAQHTMLHDSDLSGAVTFDLYGFSGCTLGDLDGDGIDDYAVGAPGHYATALGRVSVHSGADGSLLHVLLHAESLEVARFGWSVAGPGDVDGDGVPDILVGAPGGQSCGFGGCFGSRAGRARLFSGHDGSLIREWVGDEDESLGKSVAAPGDVDLDGVPDVLVGAPGAGATGVVRLYSGADGSLLLQVDGPPDAYRFGDQVVVFTPSTAAGPTLRPGFAVRDTSSNQAPPKHLRVYAWDGSLVAEHVDVGAWWLAAGGDADGDGVDDVIMSNPDEVLILSGIDGSLSAPVFSLKVGTAMFVGDVDADGRDDFATRVPGLASNVVVRSGMTRAKLASLGTEGYGLFGTSVTPLGDVNRDGHDDFLVGSVGNTELMGDVLKVYGEKGATVHSGVDIPFHRLDRGGLPGTLGVPTLRLEGTPAAGELVEITVGRAAAAAPAVLTFGTLFRPFPLLGGTQVPTLSVTRLLGHTDAHGSLHVVTRWPEGITPGDLHFTQLWVMDATAPEGWASSDAVEITPK